MKSFRSWLVGLALGATLFFGTPSAKAQTPNGITYQGVLEINNQLYSGPPVPMQFIFSNKAGTTLFVQTDIGVTFDPAHPGIFNEVLGPFPLNTMDFNEQYSMTVVVTDPSSGNTTTLAPASLLWSAPYALNAERVAGINVSATPVNGDIFPVPLDANGKIAGAMLPTISNSQNPMTTLGDMIYASDNSGTPARLGIGGQGAQLLSYNNGTNIVPFWTANPFAYESSESLAAGNNNDKALDYNAAAYSSVATGAVLTGIHPAAAYNMARLYNSSSTAFTLANNSSSSASGNRIYTLTGADETFPANGVKLFTYEATPANGNVWFEYASFPPVTTGSTLTVQTLSAVDRSSATPAILALDSETNGNAALMVQGGIGAKNSSGTADGSGLNSGSPQTYWADEVSVPAATTTSLVVYNNLVSALSTIIVTPVGVAAFGGGMIITSQSAGTFTVTSLKTLGTGGGGSMTALNYIVINH